MSRSTGSLAGTAAAACGNDAGHASVPFSAADRSRGRSAAEKGPGGSAGSRAGGFVLVTYPCRPARGMLPQRALLAIATVPRVVVGGCMQVLSQDDSAWVDHQL